MDSIPVRKLPTMGVDEIIVMNHNDNNHVGASENQSKDVESIVPASDALFSGGIDIDGFLREYNGNPTSTDYTFSVNAEAPTTTANSQPNPPTVMFSSFSYSSTTPLDHRKVYTRLEVASARQITASLNFLILSIFVSCTFMVLSTVFQHTIFEQQLDFLCVNVMTPGAKCQILRYAEFSDGFRLLEAILMTIAFTIVFILACSFSYRLWQLGRSQILYEQVWCLMLLAYTTLGFIPASAWYRYMYGINIIINEVDTASFHGLFSFNAFYLFEIAVDTELGQTLYIWGMSETYRIPVEEKAPMKLFLQKAFTFVLSVVFHSIYLFQGQTSFPETFPSIIATPFASNVVSNWQQLGSYLLVGGLSLFTTLVTMYEIKKTWHYMHEISYVKNRAKQIGFRFFVIHTALAVFSIWIIDLIALLGSQPEMPQFFGKSLGSYLNYVVPSSGVNFVTFAYTIQQVWANYPATAPILSEYLWLTVPDPQIETIKPIQYFLYEENALMRSGANPRRHRAGIWYPERAFVLEICILMFNFSWIAFSYGREGKQPRVPFQFGATDYKFVEHVFSEETDTHAVIFHSSDRIVVAFRGTMSFQNLRTDLSVMTVDFQQVFAEESVEEVSTDQSAVTFTAPSPIANGVSSDSSSQKNMSSLRFRSSGISLSQRNLPLSDKNASMPRTNPSKPVGEIRDGEAMQPLPSRLVHHYGHGGDRESMIGSDEFQSFDQLNSLDVMLSGDHVSVDAMSADEGTLPSKKGVGIHTGFAFAYSSIAPRLIECVLELYRQKKRPIYLTGHSLGGALATLCSYDLYNCLRMDSSKLAVYTFGSPMVGNRRFQTVYNTAVRRNWRVMLSSDIVTKLPSSFLYSHVGIEVLLTKNGFLLLDPSYVDTTLFHFGGSLSSHEKVRYRDAFQVWCMKEHIGYHPSFWMDLKKAGQSEMERTMKDGTNTATVKRARKVFRLRR